MLGRLFNRQDARIAATLYAACVTRARTPVFYRDYQVADTMDGRFDMITLQVVLLLNRLKAEADKRTARIAQELVDILFADMDRSLRELGIGDQGVATRVKKMGQAFYGRLNAYDAALASPDEAALASILHRNLYRNAEIDPAVLAGMAAHVRAQLAALFAAASDIFVAGTLPLAGLPQET